MFPTQLCIGLSRRLASGALSCTLGGVLFCALATGCSMSPMAKHATAFSQAATGVINSSEDGYRAANSLREREQITAAVYDYDKNPQWSPYTDFKPLLNDAQLEARIKVLDGLKAYSQSLVQLTGKHSKEDTDALESAASGVGSNLKSLSGTVSSDLGTSIAAVPAMNSTDANIVSTAVLALGAYLQARKVQGSLPKITQDMNPNVQTLCKLLTGDIKILRRQADIDYTSLAEMQNQFIRAHQNSLNPIEKRTEVEALFSIASQQRTNDELLEKLQTAVGSLALTHQALAAAAQGNNPETLKDKIAELEAAGEDLGNFYKSLPTK